MYLRCAHIPASSASSTSHGECLVMSSRPAPRPASAASRNTGFQSAGSSQVGAATAPAAAVAGAPAAQIGVAPQASAPAKQRPGRPKLATPRPKTTPSVPKRAGPNPPSSSATPAASSKPVAALHNHSASEQHGTTPVAAPSNKRARAPSTPSIGGEPQPKRQKPITGAAAAAASAAAARNAAAASAAAAAAAAVSTAGSGPLDAARAPPPQSPTSSRSRARKPSVRPKGGADSELSASAATAHSGVTSSAIAHGSGAAATAVAAAKAAAAAVSTAPGGINAHSGQVTSQNATRRGNRATATSRASSHSVLPSSYITVDGISMPGNVKMTTYQRRLFGHEIQSLMHAFGEVRFCARDVLEMMEDMVRERVRLVALQAGERAVERAEISGVQPMLDKSSIVVTVPNIAYTLRRDPRAIQRLNKALEAVQTVLGETSHEDRARRHSRPLETSSDLARELASFPDTTDTRDVAQGDSMAWAERLKSGQDIFMACAYRAEMAMKNIMTKNQLLDFFSCRATTFTRQESRSRAQAIRGKPRITLFREWLDLDAKDGISIPDDALYALGQVAWETVGTLTQTALLHRHFDDISKGCGDPRSSEWGTGRHILAALGIGVATGLMVPITDNEASDLRIELDRCDTASQPVPVAWRGYGKASSPCLLPCHLREAVRRMDRAPDMLWGLPGNSDFVGIR